MTRKFDQTLSGNEIYHAACSLLVMFKILCGKLHCQKGFNFIIFSYKDTLSGNARAVPEIFNEESFNSSLSGNAVYCTA